MKYLVTFLLAAVISQQTATPYTIKQDVLGETLAEYQRNNPGDCAARPLSDEDGAKTCKNDMYSYGGVDVRQTVYFLHDRLFKVFMFAKGNTQVAQDAFMSGLTAKFGAPALTLPIQLQNGYGATYTQTLTVWSNGVSTVRLADNARGRSDVWVQFELDDLNAEFKKAAEDAKQAKAKRDM
jgi:hypothetical protein